MASTRARWIGAGVLLALACGLAFTYRGPLRRRLLGPPPGPEVLLGRPAPELPPLPTLDGRPLRLADRRGRVVLLHFWSYGCHVVDGVLPRYAEWQRRFGDRGLDVLGVYTPERAGDVTVVQLERLGLDRPSWPLAFDAGLESWKVFHVRDSPTAFLIGRDGQVRGVRGGAAIGALEWDILRALER